MNEEHPQVLISNDLQNTSLKEKNQDVEPCAYCPIININKKGRGVVLITEGNREFAGKPVSRGPRETQKRPVGGTERNEGKGGCCPLNLSLSTLLLWQPFHPQASVSSCGTIPWL